MQANYSSPPPQRGGKRERRGIGGRGCDGERGEIRRLGGIFDGVGRLTGSGSLRSPTDLGSSSHRKRHSRGPPAFVRLPVPPWFLPFANADTLLNKQYSAGIKKKKKFGCSVFDEKKKNS